jgi:hypothetical protein
MRKVSLLILASLIVSLSVIPGVEGESEENKYEVAEFESVRLTTKTTSNRYHVNIRYVADGKRLILMAVVDNRGKGHRVLRRTVKAGGGNLTWSCLKSRFGPLKKAIVAVHLTTGDKPTVTSHSAYFN